jgi:L,D-peptidoglycan transpeptidase YkuD (ErfK/YbiS/YcfS/YnhG family)
MSEAPTVLVSAKIGPVHLGRDAYVYVRQSTLTQLREHTESLIRQYELRERAVALGWDQYQVRVIDADLGRSGADATAREGFKDLSPMSVWVGSGLSSASRSAGWPATMPIGIRCWTCVR